MKTSQCPTCKTCEYRDQEPNGCPMCPEHGKYDESGARKSHPLQESKEPQQPKEDYSYESGKEIVRDIVKQAMNAAVLVGQNDSGESIKEDAIKSWQKTALLFIEPYLARKEEPSQTSKETPTVKEDKLERIRKICHTANYDNHKYPDERSILVAIHDVIYEDCKDCRRKRDLCPKHKPSREDTGCSCKTVRCGTFRDMPNHDCPVHGLRAKNKELQQHYKEDPQPSLEEVIIKEAGFEIPAQGEKYVTKDQWHLAKIMKAAREETTKTLESLREELKITPDESRSEDTKDVFIEFNSHIDRVFDHAIDKEKNES